MFSHSVSNLSVQSLSCVQLLATPWTAAHQAPLSFTISWNLLKFMSIKLVMLCNHLIFCCLLLHLPSVFPSIRVFSKSQFFAAGGQSIGVPASAAAAAAKSLQSCPTLCDPIDGSAPGFSRQEHWSGLPFPSPMRESESEVAQSCLTLSDPMDRSLPGSSIQPGIFQARVLEWGAIAR